MITIDLADLFLVYLLLFLAVVCMLWIISEWQTYRSKNQSKAHVNCACCGAKISRKHHLIWLRCRHCGAKQQINFKEIDYGYVDWT
jgi:Fe2+ or Zn2+ uptake regulation protein